MTATDTESGTASAGFRAMGSLWLDEDWQNDLGEWEVNKDPTSKVHNTTLDSAKAVVADGLLYLYPSSEQPIQAGVGVARTVPAIENGWTIRTSAALSSEIADAAACLVVDAYTGDDSIRLLRFVFDHRFREWRLYVGVNVPNPSGKDPYWLQLLGAVSATWEHSPRRELIDVSVSLVDGMVTLGRNGNELVSFDPRELAAFHTNEGVDVGWPPSELPSSLAKVGIRNFPACGPNPPNRGRDREQRNTIVVDWVQVENR